MDLNTAERIYSIFVSSSLSPMVDKFIKTGIRYARLRVDWRLLSPNERRELDDERAIVHNAFISACDILARNMRVIGEDTSWRSLLGSDRKTIGDSGSIIHMILGKKLAKWYIETLDFLKI